MNAMMFGYSLSSLHMDWTQNSRRPYDIATYLLKEEIIALCWASVAVSCDLGFTEQ